MLGPLFRVTEKQLIAQRFQLGPLDDFPLVSDQKIMPGSLQPIIRQERDTQARTVELMNWGLVPAFAKRLPEWDPLFAIYIRSDYAMAGPVYRKHFESHRCLVPVDGFYEWRMISGSPLPGQLFVHRMPHDEPFALAGLWEARKSLEGDWMQSFTILTTCPDHLGTGDARRVPIILNPCDYDSWLDRRSPRAPPALLRTPGLPPLIESVALDPDDSQLIANGPDLLKHSLLSYKPWGYHSLSLVSEMKLS